jgi:ribosomal protein S18 acetylase RimI-like enzyme
MDRRLIRRMLANADIRGRQGWMQRFDLQGARASISDAPIAGLNCLSGFDAADDRAELLLDIGFALLRSFDRDPAVEVTPVDHPRGLVRHLEQRRMAISERRTWMRLRDDAPPSATNADVEVRVVTPDDARTFAMLHGGTNTTLRRLSLHSTIEGLLDPRRHTYYLGCIDGEAVATLHLICHKGTAGIYAVGTKRDFRRRGISTTMMARAIEDARTRSCPEVTLSTAFNGYAQSLYERQGFEPIFESQLWTVPAT